MPEKLPVNDVVVLLPGILGSVLQRDGADVWAMSPGAAWRGLVTLGRSVKDLELRGDDPEKLDLGDGVQATRLMPDLHLIPGFWKIDGYGKVKKRLFEQFDFTDGVNWFDFPYDWRRDNRAAAHRLAEVAPRWLEEYRKRPGKEHAKLVLLGHSMGGLVARYFLEALGGWEMSRALVTFGTPYRGSMNALDFLVEGYKKGLGPFKLDMSDLLRSLTSVHQLLPVYPCMDDGSGSLKKVGEVTGLPAGVDQSKVAGARGFHDEIAAAVDRNGGYGRYQICPVVGIFQPTRQSAVVRDGKVDIVKLLDGRDMGGDGTVPRVSATPIELSNDTREVYATESHASLQNFDAVLVQVSGLLTWESLAAYKGSPVDGFRLEVDDVVAPGQELEVTLATSGPVLNVSVEAENVDTGERAGGTGRLGSDGRATVELAPLAPGVYRITGRDADGVGLKPVTDIVVVGDEPAAELEASKAIDASPTARSVTAAFMDPGTAAEPQAGVVAKGGTNPEPHEHMVAGAGAGGDADLLEPVEPPLEHECPEDLPEGVVPKGEANAAARGWGDGWPGDNSSKMTTVRAGGVALSVRNELAPLIEWLVNQTVAQGYGLRQGQCWGFANRPIRGTNRPSNHSWGLAVDLNAPANPMGAKLVTDMPGWMVELWKSKMFRWGGDYRGRKDAMHYEFQGTPGDAGRLIAEVGGAGPAPAGGPVEAPAQAPAPAPPGAATGPLLKKGAEGPDVRRLQERLNAAGIQVVVDGDFGPATEQAVRHFQKERGLGVDGRVGPRTWAELG